MTTIERFQKDLERLREDKSFDEAYEMVEYLMYKVVEQNALGRAIDRAIENNIDDEELRAKLYREGIQEKIIGDEFSELEHNFIMSLKL